MEQYRDYLGISKIINSYNSNGKKFSEIKCVQKFLGADFSSPETYMKRGKLLFLLREYWKEKVGDIIGVKF